MAVAPGAALLVACLLTPGVLAVRLDREPGKPVARTVISCGLAGCVRPMLMVLDADFSFDAATAAMTDTVILCTAWSAAAGGWLLTQLIPVGVRVVLEVNALTHAAALRLASERIRVAWKLEREPPKEG